MHIRELFFRKSLRARVKELEKKVEDLSKNRTSKARDGDECVSYAQIVDEWLNGKEE